MHENCSDKTSSNMKITGNIILSKLIFSTKLLYYMYFFYKPYEFITSSQLRALRPNNREWKKSIWKN